MSALWDASEHNDDLVREAAGSNGVLGRTLVLRTRIALAVDAACHMGSW
jgi:hypothetical protein